MSIQGKLSCGETLGTSAANESEEVEQYEYSFNLSPNPTPGHIDQSAQVSLEIMERKESRFQVASS